LSCRPKKTIKISANFKTKFTAGDVRAPFTSAGTSDTTTNQKQARDFGGKIFCVMGGETREPKKVFHLPLATWRVLRAKMQKKKQTNKQTNKNKKIPLKSLDLNDPGREL